MSTSRKAKSIAEPLSLNESRSLKQSSSFKNLVTVRNYWRLLLSVLTLSAHAYFIGGVTFYRDLFASPIMHNSTMTWGIVIAAIVICLFVFFQFIYIYVSEKKLDTQQISIVNRVVNREPGK